MMQNYLSKAYDVQKTVVTYAIATGIGILLGTGAFLAYKMCTDERITNQIRQEVHKGPPIGVHHTSLLEKKLV